MPLFYLSGFVANFHCFFLTYSEHSEQKQARTQDVLPSLIFTKMPSGVGLLFGLSFPRGSVHFCRGRGSWGCRVGTWPTLLPWHGRGAVGAERPV